jgi:hypothetical protein
MWCGCLCGLFPFSLFRRKRPRSSSGVSVGSQQVTGRPSRKSRLEVSCGFTIDQTPTLNGPDIGSQTPHADERSSNNEAANSAITLHVGQETLGKEDGVVEGDTQLPYVDQEKLQILEELQKDVQPSKVDDKILPENSNDIQPFDADQEGLLIKEHYSMYERQPRKINEVSDEVHPPVLTQDTEKQLRKINEVPDDGRPPVLTQDTEKQPRKINEIQETFPPQSSLRTWSNNRGRSTKFRMMFAPQSSLRTR